MGHHLLLNHFGINLDAGSLPSKHLPLAKASDENKIHLPIRAVPHDAHQQQLTWAFLVHLAQAWGHLGWVCTSSDIGINPDSNLLMECVLWVM